jgi:hypothetical protein
VQLVDMKNYDESQMVQGSRGSVERHELLQEISIDRTRLRNSKNRMSQADSILKQELTGRSGTGSADKQGYSIEGNETTNDTRASPKQNARAFIIRQV